MPIVPVNSPTRKSETGFDPLDREDERDEHQERGRGDAAVDPVGRRVVREMGPGELAVRAGRRRARPA